MASLVEIKKKIKIIESTSKITKAMKLIATSKLKKNKDIFSLTSNYYNSIYEVIGTILDDKYSNITSNIENKCETDSTIWIIFTSNMGLCGGYNINIIKKLQEVIKSIDKIILFGKKGMNLLISRKIDNEILANINLDNKTNDYKMFDVLSEYLIENYFLDKFKNIKILYTKFVNSLNFEPNIIDAFPLDKKLFNTLSKPKNTYYVIEPDNSYLLNWMLSKYLASILYASNIESSISENASRLNAMEGATKNANDLIENYRLTFNRQRQSNITQEITEIISGNNGD